MDLVEQVFFLAGGFLDGVALTPELQLQVEGGLAIQVLAVRAHARLAHQDPCVVTVQIGCWKFLATLPVAPTREQQVIRGHRKTRAMPTLLPFNLTGLVHAWAYDPDDGAVIAGLGPGWWSWGGQRDGQWRRSRLCF